MSNLASTGFGQIQVDFSLEPFEQFRYFLDYAKKNSVREYDAMTLASVGSSEEPSARVLYMKEFNSQGLVFYTNYEGRKSMELMQNSKACANFFWPEVFLQVRIFAQVEKTSRAESEAYFATRPRMSQIGAWASRQSQEMANYDHLLARFTEYEKEFEGVEVPCPKDWGGFLLKPYEFEFWVGREGRLHERYCYRRDSSLALSGKAPAAHQWQKFMRSP